jgi:hypothetical protein
MGNEYFTNYTIEKTHYLENNFWKIYYGEHNETKQKVSVFVFDKSELNKYLEDQKEKILNFLRKESETLKKAKNQHKNFLNIIQPLTEDSSKLFFITEKISYNIKTWVEKNNDIIQKKLIINQILKVVNFMHNTYHISHNNLNINNIFIDENNTVKISCFCSTTSLEKETEKVNINICELTRNIKYFSPEMINENKIYHSSDIFSLGLIFYYILSNNELINICDNKFSSYKKFINEDNFNDLIKNNINEEYLNFILNFLKFSTKERIKIEKTLNLKFFKDQNNKLQTLCYINDLDEQEIKDSFEFLKELPNKLTLFSEEEIKKNILTNLFYFLKEDKLINPIIPSIFAICDLNNVNFKEEIYPNLKKLFKMKSLPTATLFIILRRMNYILENISLDDFMNDCIPIICKALDCGMGKIQEVIIEKIKLLYDIIDNDIFIDKIYFRLIQILCNTNDEGLIKQIFYQLKNLPKILSSDFINNKLLDDIDKILKKNKIYIICKEITFLYKKIINDIEKQNIRNKVIPNIFYILSEGEITEKLYNKNQELINELLEKLKEKREKNFIKKEDEILEEEEKIKRIQSQDLLKNNFENNSRILIKSPNAISKSTSDKSPFSGKFNDSLSSNSSEELKKDNEFFTLKFESELNENKNQISKIKNKSKFKNDDDLFENLINDKEMIDNINIKKPKSFYKLEKTEKKNINKENNNNKLNSKKSGWDSDEDDNNINNEINNILNIKPNKSEEIIYKKEEKEEFKKSTYNKNKEKVSFKEKKMEERAKKIDLDSLLED